MSPEEIQALATAIGIAIADVQEKRAQEKLLAEQKKKVETILGADYKRQVSEQETCSHHYQNAKWKSAIYAHRFPYGNVWYVCGICRKIWKEPKCQ